MSDARERRAKARRAVVPDKHFKRGELAAVVADKTGLPRVKAIAAVEAVFDTISDRLRGGQEVRLVGFGAFVVADRKAAKGRDPRTGAEIDIPEGRSVRFRAGKGLRDNVAGKIGGSGG